MLLETFKVFQLVFSIIAFIFAIYYMFSGKISDKSIIIIGLVYSLISSVVFSLLGMRDFSILFVGYFGIQLLFVIIGFVVKKCIMRP